MESRTGAFSALMGVGTAIMKAVAWRRLHRNLQCTGRDYFLYKAIWFWFVDVDRARGYLPSQPALLILPRRDPLPPSFCMTFNVLSWSSFMTTSSRQCSWFSTAQCERTTSLR